MQSNKIPNIPFQEIREQYRYDLYEDFLPFMERHVIDHEVGGFMCHTYLDGTRVSDRKLSWQQGRGIWVYSFLFRHLTHDPRHLAIAAKAVEFVMKTPTPKRGPWPDLISRTGEVLRTDAAIYNPLFLAEGLSEFAVASGNQQYWDVAKQILSDCLEVYESEDYPVDAAGYFDIGAQFNPWGDAPTKPATAQPFKGARPQGVPMCLLRLATQMLNYKPDTYVESVASRAIEDVLQKRWNPGFHLNVEFLNHDYSLPQNEYARFVYPGHTCEVMWMVMDEARRRCDEAMFDRAAERFRRHVDVAWDDVYGGYFMGARDIEANDWQLDKALWAQQEVAIGCMLLLEHRRDPWACEVYLRTHEYLKEKFALRQRRLPLYMFATDRKATFESSHYPLIENYHHPRYLALGLLACDRMIAAANAPDQGPHFTTH